MISICYNEQKSNFRLFTKPSILRIRLHYAGSSLSLISLNFYAFWRNEYIQSGPLPGRAGLIHRIHQGFATIERGVEQQVAACPIMPGGQKFQYERIVSRADNLGTAGAVHMGYRRYLLRICRYNVGHILAGYPPISKYHGGEGTVPFTVFHMFIETIFAACNSWIKQYAAMTQRAGTRFRTTVT